MDMKVRVTWLLVILGAALLSGCINLDPKADPSRFYMLGVGESCSQTRSLGLNPINIPEYLSKPYVAKREGYEIKYNQIDRWAEPLKVSIERVLSEYMGAVSPPWPVGYAPENSVSVTILDFIEEGEVVVLKASWQCNKRDPHCFETCVRMEGHSAFCMIQAMEGALQQLARAILEECS